MIIMLTVNSSPAMREGQNGYDFLHLLKSRSLRYIMGK